MTPSAASAELRVRIPNAPTVTVGSSVAIPAVVDLANLDDWLDLHDRLLNDTRNPEHHRKILENIQNPKLFASLTRGGQKVACGMGVLDGEFVGLFDIVTEPAARRQGLAAQLVLGMHAWALERSAATAYLQVIKSNEGAVALYEKLGYSTLYEYWYRVSTE